MSGRGSRAELFADGTAADRLLFRIASSGQSPGGEEARGRCSRAGLSPGLCVPAAARACSTRPVCRSRAASLRQLLHRRVHLAERNLRARRRPSWVAIRVSFATDGPGPRGAAALVGRVIWPAAAAPGVITCGHRAGWAAGEARRTAAPAPAAAPARIPRRLTPRPPSVWIPVNN